MYDRSWSFNETYHEGMESYSSIKNKNCMIENLVGPIYSLINHSMFISITSLVGMAGSGWSPSKSWKKHAELRTKISVSSMESSNCSPTRHGSRNFCFKTFHVIIFPNFFPKLSPFAKFFRTQSYRGGHQHRKGLELHGGRWNLKPWIFLMKPWPGP